MACSLLLMWCDAGCRSLIAVSWLQRFCTLISDTAASTIARDSRSPTWEMFPVGGRGVQAQGQPQDPGQ